MKVMVFYGECGLETFIHKKDKAIKLSSAKTVYKTSNLDSLPDFNNISSPSGYIRREI